ncbi:MAG: hypothetical protein ABR517_03745 [Thermoanaerobaculia bacterium]
MERSLGLLVQELLRREPVAALLAGTVGDLDGRRFEWPISEELRLAAVRHQAVIPAGATLFVEIDGDGALFGGSFTFDPDRESFLIVGISAVVEGRTGIPGQAPPVAGRVAFAAGADVVLSNGFLHPKDEPVREALPRDLTQFILPGELGDRRPRTAETGEPSQYVHLGGSGSISLSGSLRWRSALLETGVVSIDGLELHSALLEARAGAEMSWRGSLEGTFDLIIFAVNEGRLEARLTKSRLSRERSSFQAHAEIVVAGADAMAEAVLEPLFGPAEDLVRLLEKELAAIADLRALFRSEAAEELERLLEDDRVIEGIRRWLEKIGIDVDLRRRVRAVLADAVGIAAAGSIDRIEKSAEPAIDAMRELLREYRLAIRKIDTELREAARVEVGLALSRTSASGSKAADLLTLRFGSRHSDLLTALLRGDLDSALTFARQETDIEIEGSLRREGSLSIEAALEVRFLWARAGIGNMLRHSWDYEVGAFGDVTIATRGTLEVWSRNWRSLRTLRVLVDSRVTGALAGAVETDRNRLSVEWAIELRPTLAQLDRWERRLVRAGLLPAQATMISDLALVGEAHRQRPFGEVLLTARFDAAHEILEAFAERSPDAVRNVFARILAEEYADSAPLKPTDGAGLPIFAWPEVLTLVRRGELATGRYPLAIRGRGEREATIQGDHAPLIAFAARLVLSFGEVHRDLRALRRRAATLDDPHGLALEISRVEKRLLRRIRSITTSATLRRADLGFAFFRALFELWRVGSNGKARVVVLRKTDRRRFLYAMGD